MTEHELQLLAIGFTLGMYAMLIAEIIRGLLDERRDRKARRAAEAKLKAAEERAAA
ncbi:hypothetical protein [Streptomyces sp. NPDC007264]|uniref:hypothetical protein n=1 Tax=Streptomyces sp. NPDC007264 TaxID=3364777 RepID=UPI0036D954D0